MLLGRKLVRMFYILRVWSIPIGIVLGCYLLGGVRVIAIIIALACFLLRLMMSAQTARQPVAAAILVGYGAITSALVALAFAFPWGDNILQWFLIVTIGLTVAAYALPQSFWRLVGLQD